LLKRHFTKEGISPYDMFEYDIRTSIIKDIDGSIVFEMNNVEVPKGWSQVATDILAQKYFRKAGVPELEFESSIKQVVHRLTETWTHWGLKEGYFKKKEAEIFKDELAYMLLNQMAAPNSPQWFNTGLYHVYGIKGKAQGHYYYNTDSNAVVKSKSAYERPQPHACFILSVDDDLVNSGGIMDLWTREARIFKYGSGVGSNFSNLRGKGEKLSGGGTSSGLMSFLKIGDAAAGAIKSGGTTRRAAKMVCLDVDHPEIKDFITWKMNEETKVQALIDYGYDSHYEGEAYRTVSGQNSNNSIRVSDEFLKAVQNNSTFNLINRSDGGVYSTESAKEIWDLICEAAWKSADPGLQYDDTINKWHTSPEGGRINASNPCSEYMFLDNTACNLASLNLKKFLKPNLEFDVEGFIHATELWTTVLEISVAMAQFPSKEVAELSYKYRTLGLGYANLGALLMTKGIAYDSKEARDFAAKISALMQATAYKQSALMAEKLGMAPGHVDSEDRATMLSIVQDHYEEWGRLEYPLDTPLHNMIEHQFDLAIQHGTKSGFRNAQVTVIAPTGTIGLLMDCDTTGIEPDFALMKYKKLSGGGYIQLANNSVKTALQTLGYNEMEIDILLDYLKEHQHFEGSILNPKHLSVFDCANKCGNGERYIHANAHVDMMAAVQPFISGAISKTVNLPNEATVKDISDIYIRAWESGVKAIAIYRDGSKLSQPLNSKKEEESDSTFIPPKEKKLPNKRKGYTWKAKINGQTIFIRTGEYDDGTLGELFIDMYKEGATVKSLLNTVAISISLGLQHGVPLKDYVDKFSFSKFDPSGIVQGHSQIKFATSVVDFVMRLLANEYLNDQTMVHIPNESIVVEETNKFELVQNSDSPACPKCGHITVRNGTCYKCLNCGESLGCS
jgi:ribonucleoside-diphosphate reductase alpha chain